MYNDRWFNGLDENKKTALQQILSEDNLILDRLKELCYNTLNELETQQMDFKTPEWAYRQAALLGERKALKRVIALCTDAKASDQTP